MRPVKRIPLDLIDSSPFNVRQQIDTVTLTKSILDAGQIVPLRLRPVGDRYQIRSGERRFNALKQAGATHADAIVVEGSDEEVIDEQWMENEERDDYTDYERAMKLRQMLDALGLTQEQLAEKIGKGQSWVSRHLAILKLEEFMPRGIIHKLSERHARVIVQAPEEDWSTLVHYVEVYFEEQDTFPSVSTLEEYTREATGAREFEKTRRFIYEIEGKPAPYETSVEEPLAESTEVNPEAFIEEHNLGWVFDVEANGAGFLTKIQMITDEELEFCLAHETRPLSLQRLNEETDRRDPRPLLKQPPVTASPIITSEEEESLTTEEYVADVLTYNPEVKHSELVKATVEMFDVSEEYVQGLIDRSRKRRDLYATKSPTTLCPLCGRANAQKNRILMILEEYQAAQPGVTLVDWLREVLA
ncbi:ParB/RepB/Spo0J family partition protein [Candidatus Bathyarchaeota archaeon]|nr:ParB/RepB/Spo0J family partition protein [Candidatus Bathyarchaeota archaeon]